MSQETVVLFSFSQATIYSCHSALRNYQLSLCVRRMSSASFSFRLHPLPGCGLSSALSNMVCGEQGRGLRNYVEWLEWLPGTCEESPRRSLGDNGASRLAGLYFVHMIHFTRIQATAEWRINTSCHLIEARDSKQTNRADRLEYEIKDSLRPFVVPRAAFALNGKICR